MKRFYPIFILIGIYLLLWAVILIAWHKNDINSVNGDEPHYLVMAHGIVTYGSFEQTRPYKDEFSKRSIFKKGLAPQDSNPSPENTQAVLGPHGLYNIHNIGLPIIISLPYKFGGVAGAKIFMVLIGVTAILFTWNITGIFSANTKIRFLSTLALCIALPLLPASNQIYPDLPAGIVSLSGLYWFMTLDRKRPIFQEFIWAAAIVFLPWLHIKFSMACALLIIALMIKKFILFKDMKGISILAVLSVLSSFILFAYNYYAFNRLSGPYPTGTFEFSGTSIMVLFGLHADQNQGFLMQNLILLIGLGSIGGLYRRDRATAIIWLFVYASLLIPNAFLLNWYGGTSFSGRFGWSAAVVFFLPTALGLARIDEYSSKLFKTIIAITVLLQAYFFFNYALCHLDLYNKPPLTMLDSYSLFYHPIQKWFPAFYCTNWAYRYTPNYAWGVLIALLVASGFASAKKIKKRIIISLAIGCSFIFAAGFYAFNLRKLFDIFI
ncbi:MAG: hypothetical protein KA369_06930 [Spirochaetes bacterium]|nr:hypothetical protein [Spirochaetota bacterium]